MFENRNIWDGDADATVTVPAEAPDVPPHLEKKLRILEETLFGYGSVALGFSGGVDSTFLAAVCARCMPERTLLIHFNTPFIGTPERASFEREARRLELPLVELDIDPLDNPAIASNPANRCYHCKKHLFDALVAAARMRGVNTILDGSNADDAGDYRPGMQALRELGVKSPLMDCGWRREEERVVLRAWGHPVWNLPAGACLATRIANGKQITREKLEAVRACEDHLHALGLHQVRFRMWEECATVSAPENDLAKLMEQGLATRDRGACVTLSPSLRCELTLLSDVPVEPHATLYQHGETSVSM